ncbi:hypothetical protein NM208_g1051 [Fusarium decemcellulare]|uniref:Uncharacterized protein n=1 Tax=Fusarium decemcellulare TaxID=57161 RepID=A0ACC1SXD8_9HYPO|nr:hypothetical protein NM208_g1051 [Fusarium decemcellulare]
MFQLLDRVSSLFDKDAPQLSGVNLAVRSEYPDITFFGGVEEETDAIIPGEVTLEVDEDEVFITSLDVKLNLHISYKRPFKPHCHRCRHRTSQLQNCQLLNKPARFARGKLLFPFVVSLDGRNPTSTENSLIAVKYEITAEAKIAHKRSATLETIVAESPIIVKRALAFPEMPQHSVRKVDSGRTSAQYHSIIRPMEANRFTFEFDGLGDIDETGVSRKWELRKVTWLLVEETNLRAPACDKHRPRTAAEGDWNAELRTRETQILSDGVLQNDWTPGRTNSNVKMEFEYATDSQVSKSGELWQSSNGRLPGGAKISHCLVLWLHLSLGDERQSKAGQKSTGINDKFRRLSYDIEITDCADKDARYGVEAPPLYGTVSHGPPVYI